MTGKPLTCERMRDILEKLRTGLMTPEEYMAALPDMTLEEYYRAALPAEPYAARVLAELHRVTERIREGAIREAARMENGNG